MKQNDELVEKLLAYFKDGSLNPDSELRADFDQTTINEHKLLLEREGWVEVQSHPSSRGERPKDEPDFVFIKRLTDFGREELNRLKPDDSK
mgnify:CR=1 FL=1